MKRLNIIQNLRLSPSPHLQNPFKAPSILPSLRIVSLKRAVSDNLRMLHKQHPIIHRRDTIQIYNVIVTGEFLSRFYRSANTSDSQQKDASGKIPLSFFSNSQSEGGPSKCQSTRNWFKRLKMIF